jgi:hypothetical protein
VSGAPAVFRAAPLDRAARLTTRAMWAGSGLLLAIGAWLAGDGEGAGWVVLAAGGLLLATLVYLWRLQPVEYVVEEDAFSIRRRSAASRRFTGAVTRARLGRLGLRVGGDGGAYGYLGRFRADGRTVRAFVTDRGRVALLDVGGAELAVSPSDRESFLAEVRRG